MSCCRAGARAHPSPCPWHGECWRQGWQTERVELLTPLNTPAATAELRDAQEHDVFDHRAEIMADGVHVLVRPIRLAIREHPTETPRPALAP